MVILYIHAIHYYFILIRIHDTRWSSTTAYKSKIFVQIQIIEKCYFSILLLDIFINNDLKKKHLSTLFNIYDFK
jgi:hypothetical protein